MGLGVLMEKNSWKDYIVTFKHWSHSFLMAFIHAPHFLKAAFLAKPVPLEVALHRLAICYECEKLDLITNQCKECWCFIHLKVRWLDESCPLNRWLE